jgi:hypothetical protein
MSPETNKTDAPQRESERPPAPAESKSPTLGDLLEKVVTATEIESRDKLIVQRAELDYKQRLAKLFAKSHCFVDIDKDPEGNWLPEEVSIARAVVKIELGASMGFSPAESMTGIDIIKGRVAIGASLRAARMQRAGYFWPQAVMNNKGCWLPLCFEGKPMLQPTINEEGAVIMGPDGLPVMSQIIVSFTKADAELAGLAAKDNYRKDPSSMYFARAVTRAQRRYGPGVLGVDALDTYEAYDLPSATSPAKEAPAQGSISLDQFKASSDENRGHERTQPNSGPLAPSPASTPQATATPGAEAPTGTVTQPDTAAPAETPQRPTETTLKGESANGGASAGPPVPESAAQPSDRPPADLPDLEDWPDIPEDPWYCIKGVIYHWHPVGEKYEPVAVTAAKAAASAPRRAAVPIESARPGFSFPRGAK